MEVLGFPIFIACFGKKYLSLLFISERIKVYPHSQILSKMITQNIDLQFAEIAQCIQKVRLKVLQRANVELVGLYWQIGKYIQERVENAEWGKSVVKHLAEYLIDKVPESKGFSPQNLWRMKQFYEAYNANPKLSPLVRELSWTHNCLIINACKTIEEKEFYLHTAFRERYTKRELERQIKSGLFERAILADIKMPLSLKQMPQNTENLFRDPYMLDFLNLPNRHSEKQLRDALLNHLKDFVLELGKDFLFIDKEYRIQVGDADFFIDLLFYHRGLQCLVALELKTEKFQPENVGQLNFYLEALDRDVRRENENPSIGILLCKSANDEVVEYAMSRNISPTMIATYEQKLIPKQLLQKKLRELMQWIEES